MGNIAILCSGGDVSGMNPALKRFVEYSFANDMQPYFVYDGFEGLLDNRISPASYCDVAGIINQGGTKIGSARSKRFMDPIYRKLAKDNLDALGIDKLVVLGGDGSFRGMEKLYSETGIAFSGIPSTIDNDIAGTEYCLGVDTALNVIKVAIDNIRDTASSFKRAFVIETMGRDCGYLALVSGLTSGSELCLIPEIPYDLGAYEECFRRQIQNGRRSFITIISEGVPQSAEEIAHWFEEKIGIDSRVTVLGHTQRGGNPTTYDRLMAFRFVTKAIDGLLSGHLNSIVCFNDNHFEYRTIDDVANQKYELNPELLQMASQYTNFFCRI